MGSNKQPVEKKRKKKGRPSLLDLQKRSLRLQKQQDENPNPNPNPSATPNPSASNPYLRFPAPRRSARRSADNSGGDDEEGSDDDDDERREKKLKLVVRIPNSASSASESDKGDEPNSASKTTAAPHRGSDPSGPGPATKTPLPDRKLLEFVLDRVQKKDTYGVFSEPVDPEELPDYHDIIKHPMDFGTVRKKLAGGDYKSLEQFEEDVFLISSNGMQYNAPDTIYYRQARAIQELAKKNFENLRQESDDNEPDLKTVRRGRPPTKNTMKRNIGKPVDRASSDFSSDATLANAGDNHWSNLTQDLSRKGLLSDRPNTVGTSAMASAGLRNPGVYTWANEHRSEKSEEYSGSMGKSFPLKNGKKTSIFDDNRRSTYKLSQLSACAREPSVLTTFDGEKKLLVPVGLQMEHAYARSLARFAAKFGPVGWEIVSKRIERILPPGTKFGRGWIGDGDASQKSQQSLLSLSSTHASSQTKIPPCTSIPKAEQNPDIKEAPAANLAAEEAPTTSAIQSASVSAVSNSSSDAAVKAQPAGGSSRGGGCTVPVSGGSGRPRTPFQLHPKPAVQQPIMNGFNPAYGYNLLSQVEKFVKPVRPPISFGTDAIVMTHSRALDMVSRSNSSVNHQPPVSQLHTEQAKLAVRPIATNSVSSLPNPIQDSKEHWQGVPVNNPKPAPTPPDLNVGFQTSGSPVSGVVVDSQQPDLALQL